MNLWQFSHCNWTLKMSKNHRESILTRAIGCPCQDIQMNPPRIGHRCTWYYHFTLMVIILFITFIQSNLDRTYVSLCLYFIHLFHYDITQICHSLQRQYCSHSNAETMTKCHTFPYTINKMHYLLNISIDENAIKKFYWQIRAWIVDHYLPHLGVELLTHMIQFSTVRANMGGVYTSY